MAACRSHPHSIYKPGVLAAACGLPPTIDAALGPGTGTLWEKSMSTEVFWLIPDVVQYVSRGVCPR
jgi:hypothetical protein